MELLTTIFSWSLLITVTIAQRFDRQGFSGNRCTTPDNVPGSCVSLEDCPGVVQLYERYNGSPQVVAFLRAAQRNCGNRVIRGNPVVCCSAKHMPVNPNRPQQPITQNPNQPQQPFNPNPNNPFLPSGNSGTTRPQPTTTTTTFIPPPMPQPIDKPIQQRAGDCIGPDARPGVCQSLVECTELLERLQASPNDQSFAQFLRLSNEICRTQPPIICCPSADARPTPKPLTIPNALPTIRPVQTKEARLLTPEEGCGQSSVAHRKIVGGHPSQLGSWPWIALLGYDNGLGQIDFRCGGSLITKRHILTAAHCIRNNLNMVRLGEHNLETDSETRHRDVKVIRSVQHPDYSTSDGHSDIAVLYLADDIQFSETIRPVCVPEKVKFETRSLVGYNPFVAGWGKTIEGGNSSTALLEVQLPILGNNQCKERYKAKKRLISERQFDDGIICAGVLQGGKDTCQGDSGGPLMLPEKLNIDIFYYNLLGIVSYGIGCARAGIPGVYASVPHFADWVRQKVAEPT